MSWETFIQVIILGLLGWVIVMTTIAAIKRDNQKKDEKEK